MTLDQPNLYWGDHVDRYEREDIATRHISVRIGGDTFRGYVLGRDEDYPGYVLVRLHEEDAIVHLRESSLGGTT